MKPGAQMHIRPRPYLPVCVWALLLSGLLAPFTAFSSSRLKPASDEIPLSPIGLPDGAGAASQVALARDIDGNLCAAWVARRSEDAQEVTTWVRWFDETLTPLGANYHVSLAPYAIDVEDFQPAISSAPDGSVLVTWTRRQPAIPDNDTDNVFLGRVRSPDVASASDIAVNTTLRWTQSVTSVAAEASGLSIVVWDNSELDPNDETVRYRLFRDSGPDGPEKVIQNVPETRGGTLLTTGSGFFVAWMGRQGSGDRTIYLAKIDASGEMGDPVPASPPGQIAEGAALAAVKDDGVLVVWRAAESPSAPAGLFSRVFSSDLGSASDVHQIWLDPAPQERRDKRPVVASAPGGEHAAVAWITGDTQTEGGDVMLEVVDSQGRAVGDPRGVASVTAGYQHGPRVLYLSDDRLLVSWSTQPDRSSLDSLIVVGRLFDVGALKAFCGDSNDDGFVLASDGLAALQAAVGLSDCPPCLCDANGSGAVTAVDALAILQSAVGLSVPLQCPECTEAQ